MTPAFVVADAFPLPTDARPIHTRAQRSDGYAIHVTRTLPQTLDRLTELVDGATVALVSDETVMGLHGSELLSGLRERGVDVLVATLPPGERSKSLEQATALWHWLADSPIARRDVLVSFGGGVVCDTAGWVASGSRRTNCTSTPSSGPRSGPRPSRRRCGSGCSSSPGHAQSTGGTR
jgi:3-dehydroquinate synthase